MRDDSFKDFVLDQVSRLGRVEARAMFGGYGLYQGKTFFGILFKGRLYFKTSPATRVEYVRRGLRPFRPSAKQTLTSYYEVPVEIIEDDEALTAWATLAVQSQGRRRRQPRS